MKEENVSDWRRCVSGDLASVFRPYDEKAAQLEYLNRNKFVVEIERARYKEIPSNYKKLDVEQIEDINNNPLTRHSSPTRSPVFAPRAHSHTNSMQTAA